MRIHATINERMATKRFVKTRKSRNGITVIDRDLPAFALKVAKIGRKSFVVTIAREIVVLGTPGEMSVHEARAKALAPIGEAKGERDAGGPFADFAADFMRRRSLC